jgi:class 3 adenylate cyclase
MMILLVCCGLLLAAFFWALQSGWFSRIERGFLLTIVVAIAGFTVLSAAVSGLLAYTAGRDIVHQEIVAGLSNAGDIVEANIRDTIRYEVEQLHEYVDFLAADVAVAEKQGRASEQLTNTLRHMDALNKEILQISVFDTTTRMLATSYITSSADRTNLVAVATALEGNDYVSDAHISPVSKTWVLTIATPIRDAKKQIIGALSIRYDLQSQLASLVGSTRFGAAGYAVITSGKGRILAHIDPKRINSDVSSFPAFRAGKEGSGWLVANNVEGQRRLFVYRPVNSPATESTDPWVLFVEMEEANVLAPIDKLRNEVLFAVAILAIPGLIVGWRVAVSISHPVGILAHFVRRVQGGDFTGRVTEGRDEVGRLGVALNLMTKGLAERDRVKELFGRYVTAQVSERIVKGDINLGGESRRVTMLFSDIRSFTSMSEQMSPAEVVTFLNSYFSDMVEAVFEQGGVLDKFMGDGMLAVFGSMGDMPDHPRRAVLAALRMKALLSKINGERSVQGKLPIAIGIGVHTDEVIVGNIGSRRRLEYTVIGDGVNTCSRVQTMNKEFGTTILITQTTYEELKGEFECRPMGDRALRGKANLLTLYEVISAKAAWPAGIEGGEVLKAREAAAG